MVGRPIGHSLSPVMHRAAYAALGIDWSYDAIELADGELAAFATALDDTWRGLSVTMPFKREAAALAVRRSDDVAFLGVANTLVRQDDGWHASNTDVPGAVAALREAAVDRLRTVRLLGAGATAASVLLAASRLGATELRLHARDSSRVAEVVDVAAELGLDVDVLGLDVPAVDHVDLLVNTIPVAATAGREHELAGAARAVFEVVYDPWPTPLMLAAQRQGLPLVTGIDLLVHQAVHQVVAMTGEPVDPQVLRDAALNSLAAG